MTITKTTERITKDYVSSTEGVESIENVQFILKDGDTQIGSANIQANQLSLNIYGLSGKSITDLTTILNNMIAQF